MPVQGSAARADTDSHGRIGPSRCSRWSRSRCSSRQRSSASRPTLTARPCRSEAHFSRSARSRYSVGPVPGVCFSVPWLFASPSLAGSVLRPSRDSCPWCRTPGAQAAWAVLATGLAFYGALFWRALRFHRLTQRSADLFVALGVAWLASALPVALLLDDGSLGSLLGLRVRDRGDRGDRLRRRA